MSLPRSGAPGCEPWVDERRRLGRSRAVERATLADPFDDSAPLDDRARAYLHTNCAQCHRPGGPTPVSIDLRYTTALANTGTCDAVPETVDLDLPDPRIVDPGDPANSVLLLRMDRRDRQGMPPLASAQVDTEGVALISSWINNLAGCN